MNLPSRGHAVPVALPSTLSIGELRALPTVITLALISCARYDRAGVCEVVAYMNDGIEHVELVRRATHNLCFLSMGTFGCSFAAV
jgi:hypothetical protein